MNGYPKNLNSKSDYLYVMQNFPKEQWERGVKDLLESESDWFFDHELAEGEAGVTDATHKVVENQDTSGKTTRSQFVWKSNPDAKMYKLGFTKEELERFLS